MDLPIKGKISLTKLIEMGSKRHVVNVDLQIRKDFTKITGEFKGLILFPLIVKVLFVMTHDVSSNKISEGCSCFLKLKKNKS